MGPALQVGTGFNLEHVESSSVDAYELASSEVASKPILKCPSCGSPMEPGAVVCIECGYNTQLGRKVGQPVQSPDEPIRDPQRLRALALMDKFRDFIGPAIVFGMGLIMPGMLIMAMTAMGVMSLSKGSEVPARQLYDDQGQYIGPADEDGMVDFTQLDQRERAYFNEGGEYIGPRDAEGRPDPYFQRSGFVSSEKAFIGVGLIIGEHALRVFATVIGSIIAAYVVAYMLSVSFGSLWLAIYKFAAIAMFMPTVSLATSCFSSGGYRGTSITALLNWLVLAALVKFLFELDYRDAFIFSIIQTVVGLGFLMLMTLVLFSITA